MTGASIRARWTLGVARSPRPRATKPSRERDKIAGDRCLAFACRLKIDRDPCPHCGRDIHVLHLDAVRVGYAELIHAAIGPSLEADRRLDLRRVEIETRFGGRLCGRLHVERRSALLQRSPNLSRQVGWIALT
jgi:hypothetical protein